ncbi:MAG: hypothetical protein WAV46_03425 [Candidatus Moraniibacteriota bacterium]
MKKVSSILLNATPVLIMIGLIPIIQNDYLLTFADLGIIIASLVFKRYRNDVLVLIVGFCIMIVSEYLFISTGVETFNRNGLFGLMPLWLPFLWGYGFVAIKRSIAVIDTQN